MTYPQTFETEIQQILGELDALHAEQGKVGAAIRSWADIARRTASTARQVAGGIRNAKAGSAAPVPVGEKKPEAPPAVITNPEAPQPPSKAVSWYYTAGKETVGPVSETQLRGKIAEGIITQKTLVWREAATNWITAQEAGLFPAASSAGAAACAFCGSVLKANAAFCIQCGMKVVAAELAKSVCPSCRSTFKPGLKFCGRCGARLS